MYKEFPIGTFFLWRAPMGSPPLSRPLTELGIPSPQAGMPVSYILDGQQCLTSLYAVIEGLTIDSKDYGRICLDLETATRFEKNKDESFEEDIFVYGTSDNKRYVAVHDLVGPNSLIIFDGIDQEWKPAFNKARNLFTTYPFSVVWIQEQTLGDAVVIFQRINQAGKRLSRYDLVCANVWTEDFDFRRRVADVNKKFNQQGFGKLDETIYTQTFALVIKDQCITAIELSLQAEEILQVWNGVIRALEVAVDFAFSSLGVKRAEYMPYRGLLVVLAYYFYHRGNSAISAQERIMLWNWFWQVTLSERYSSTSPSRMAEDAKRLRSLKDGQPVSFNYPSKVTVEAVARTKITSTTSALRNAVLCLLALREPRNFKDNSPVNLTDSFFTNLKKPERHHIFPVSYLKTNRVLTLQVHLLPNFCFIPADLNKEILSKAPADYLAEYQRKNPSFALSIASHLVPIGPGAAVWKNDFSGFLAERAQLIANELNKLVEAGPSAPSEEAPLAEVDVLEIRLRDFIDHRLISVMGAHYWRKTMPGDVVTKVKGFIEEWKARHPYEDEPRSGRQRLDFCDVGDYEKIIMKNWDQFGEFFGQRKDELSKHMAAYRALRNCVQHNRPPTDVEQKNGDAALLWLGRILDQYYRDIAAAVEENGEEASAEEIEGEV